MSSRSEAIDAWEALYRAQVAVLREIRAEFPEGELSFTEYDVLFNLSRMPDRAGRIRDLNRRLLLTQPSVSRLLDRLATRGLVTKSGDPNDARGTIITLTDRGYNEFRRVAVLHGASIARRMAALGSRDLRELTRITDRLRMSITSE